jgi:hypothetical protein
VVQPTTEVGQAAAVFRGARVCFTGDAADLEGRPMSRPEIEERARRAGLVPVASVTKTRCDLLVAAELGTQSGKARKAAEYGKPVISVAEFLTAEPGDPPPQPRRDRARKRSAPGRQTAAARADEAAAALRLQRDGLTQAEIAARLGRSQDSVKGLLSDGRFYAAPGDHPEREAQARDAARLLAATGGTRQAIVARLGLGKKAAETEVSPVRCAV